MYKKVEWVLRIAVAGEFIGHGVFALQGRQAWIDWFSIFGISDVSIAAQILFFVGLTDVLLAVLILIKPVRLALLWMAFWGLWTALVRWPFGPDPVWDFVERWANWGAPLALLLSYGWPKTAREWFK